MNNFQKAIASNIEKGDRSYAHDIECWEKHIRFTIDIALSKGLSIGVCDGEEITVLSSTNADAIMAALFTTDEDYLLFYREGDVRHFAWVYLIYGNGCDEVISDYTTNLTEIFMEEVNRFADTLI